MKFIIKASAVAVSDTKFAKRGEYETDDAKEIERLKNTAKKFPKDLEEISSGGSKKKDEQKEEANNEEATVVDEPQEEHPRRRR